LTNLYNQLPTQLDNAHKKLDAAVFAAYDWLNDSSGNGMFGRLSASTIFRRLRLQDTADGNTEIGQEHRHGK
jgi:hypothetical protein